MSKSPAKKLPTRRRPATKIAALEQPGSHLLDDGSLTVRIKDGDKAGTVFKLDLMATKVALEAVEAKHKVGTPGFVVTASLLTDLAAALLTMPGVDYCTPTMAYRLWCLINTEFINLKKAMG